MSHSVQALVFDVGDVIATQDRAAADAAYAAVRADLSTALVNRARNGAALYELWVGYSVGAVDGDVYWDAVAAALGLDPAAGPRLRHAHGSTVWAVRDPDVMALIGALARAGAPALGVLSNSAPDCEPHIPAFAGLFRVLHFSHRTGRRKPDAEAYTEVARALGVGPEQAVFIDDKPRNVEAARRAGMRAIAYVGARDLAQDLAALGVPLHGSAGGSVAADG